MMVMMIRMMKMMMMIMMIMIMIMIMIRMIMIIMCVLMMMRRVLLTREAPRKMAGGEFSLRSLMRYFKRCSCDDDGGDKVGGDFNENSIKECQSPLLHQMHLTYKNMMVLVMMVIVLVVIIMTTTTMMMTMSPWG